MDQLPQSDIATALLQCNFKFMHLTNDELQEKITFLIFLLLNMECDYNSQLAFGDYVQRLLWQEHRKHKRSPYVCLV